MTPKLRIRAALLVPLLSLGLLVSGPGVGLTRADTDTPPASCEVADVTGPAEATTDTLLLLRAILPADADPPVMADLRQPRPDAPIAPRPNAPTPAVPISSPKPPGTDLRVPDGALLTLEPIVAARQFRESLNEKQKADLQAVVAKHQDALQRARARLPELTADAQGTRPLRGDQVVTLNQASTELTQIGDQVDTEIESILTPGQRALLQKANPKRLRADLPETPANVAEGITAGC